MWMPTMFDRDFFADFFDDPFFNDKEMRKLEKVLAMIRYKEWYYEQAIKDGNEDRVRAMLPDHLPEEIQIFYNLANE